MPENRILSVEDPNQTNSTPGTWVEEQAADLASTTERFVTPDEPTVERYFAIGGWVMVQKWLNGRRFRYTAKPGGRCVTVELGEPNCSWGLVASGHVPPEAEPLFSAIPEAKLSEVDQMVMQHFAIEHWRDAQERGHGED